MKLIKLLIVVLLLVNVGLYLWAGAPADHGARAPLAQPEVNREGMLLLRELPGAGRAPPITGAGAAPCYRIGPFKKEAEWLAATRWMDSRQLPYRAARSESREMRAIQIFLGPFASPAAAQPAMDRLDAQAIEHFLIWEEGGAARVSLGYFAQEALAAKFVAHLLSRGVTAGTRMEYRAMGSFDWMEVSADAAARNLLAAHRWPGKGVAVLEISCDGISPPAGG